jgi:outer membrane autotransporter protein
MVFNGGSITTTGIAYALATDSGAQLEASNVIINTSGVNANGLLASGNSAAVITGTSITTSGDNARGLQAQSGSTLSASDTTISTSGVTAYGVAVATGGTATATNVSVMTTGEGASAARSSGEGSLLDISSGNYRSEGAGTHAVHALGRATVNISHEDGAQNTRITTTGEQAAGIYAESGATINAAGINLSTLGNGSHAVVAETGSTINLVGGGFNPNGIGAHGVVASGGSTVTMNGSIFQVFGADGHGISLADDSTIVAANSYISSYAPALKTESGNAVYDLRSGTTVVGTYGTVLTAAAGSTTTLKADDRVLLSGDMIAEASDAVIDASLSNGSQWFGAAKGLTTAAIDGTSHWLMTGSSDVGSLTNDGMVEFDAANPHKTLTVGALDVNDGSFILNTKLNEGGAASETDKIVVTGDVNGSGLIHIRNNGGTGAFTGTDATDGIQVVQVGGASNAEFQLGSAAVVGIYDYQLKKADGQNWYLQTEGNDVVDPGDGSIGNPGTGHVVDIVPGYNVALSAAQNHVLTSLDTFHERLGELHSEELQDGFHAWTRGIGKTGSYSPKNITGYNGRGFDMTTAGVQFGGDYSKGDVFMAGDRLTAGVFGEYANSSFDVRGRTADGSISSNGLGGYVTWQQKAPTDRKPATGVYVDAVVKHDWLDFGVNARSVSDFDLRNGYKGKATSASIEAGYGFDLGNNVVLQPQAQLTYSKIKADSFTDGYGIAVHGQEAESLIGRVGVRLEKTFYFGDEEEETLEVVPAKPVKSMKGKNGAKAKTAVISPLETPKKKKFVKSVTTYTDANVKHEFKGKNSLAASNTGIGNDMGGTRFDVGVGVVARVSENVSLFGRGAVEFGGSTNVAGKVSVGLKIAW